MPETSGKRSEIRVGFEAEPSQRILAGLKLPHRIAQPVIPAASYPMRNTRGCEPPRPGPDAGRRAGDDSGGGH